MDDILEHFKATGALLEGHFILSSGLHSPKYLQCALALRHPSDAKRFGQLIADQVRDRSVEMVASPAIGGLVIGFAVAAALDIPFIWTERQNGVMTLRRGFSLESGQRILVVEDVITTGGSTRECISVLSENGGVVVEAASIIDRSDGTADVGVPRLALVQMDVPSFEPDECPMCARGDVAVKPGSRI